ncbi:MAG: tetratricopeptide repeat protein [Bacteroidota bacterium]|nr:tetratricopeptide repeat protein [Bacteroidota bacterium]
MNCFVRFLSFYAVVITVNSFALCRAEPQSAEQVFARANDFYKNADYKRAAQLYEELIHSGIEAEEVYFNLGNCYYKLGNTASAILNYERAHRLNPTDDDIEFNLELARRRVIDNIEPAPQVFIVRWWRILISLATPSTWGMGAVVCAWMCCLSAMLFLIVVSPRMKKILFTACIVSMLLAAVMLLFAFQQEHKTMSAIVFAPSIAVKSEPQESSKDLFVLHEGTKIDILDTDGEWCKIRILDGSVGWMRISAMRII